MGTALIKSHIYADRLPPRGCRLAVDPALLVHCPSGVVISDYGGPAIVDWIHSKTAITEHIIEAAGLDLPPLCELEKKLVAYVAKTGHLAVSDWGRNTLSLNGCAPLGAMAS